jgi:multidrug efflux pump subunit AcrA (membrane-fusion protein)
VTFHGLHERAPRPYGDAVCRAPADEPVPGAARRRGVEHNVVYRTAISSTAPAVLTQSKLRGNIGNTLPYQHPMRVRARTSSAAIILLVLVATGVLGSACKTERAGLAAPGGPGAEPKEVTLVSVQSETLGSFVTGTGTLAADEEAGLAFKVPGRVTAIAVDLGSTVRRGDPVARLDPGDYELRVRQAEAALQQARARLGLDPGGRDDAVNPEETGTVRQARAVLDEARANRARGQKLVDSGVISRAEFDAYESAYKVADARYQDALDEVQNRRAVLQQRRSELDLARQQLADTVLRAPFDGAVSQRVAGVGEFVAAGAEIAKLVRLNPLRLKSELPEREAAGVRPGLSVRVRAEGSPDEAMGRVARVSPVVEERSRVLVVEVEVDNQRGALKPGGYARAEIITDTGTTALTVPASAVVAFAGVEKVFVVAEGKAAEKLVTTGRRQGDRVEVLTGLEATDTIVAEPGNLVVGQAVAVR